MTLPADRGGGDGGADQPTGLRAAIAAPRLRAAVAAQTFSTTANQIVGLVVPWLVLQRTGDPVAAGTVLLATGLAAVLGTVIGGTMVDRFGARRISILSDSLSAVTLLVIPVGLWTDRLPLWLIILSQVAGVLFDGPGVVARNTLLAATARRDRVDTTSATSLQKTLQSSATFVGPLVGGFLLAGTGAGPTLVAAAAAFVVAIITVLRVPASLSPPTNRESRGRWSADVADGLRYLRRDELLGPMTLLLGFWVAVAAPVPTLILPAWFQAEGLPASRLGLLLGAQAVGGILGGLFHVAFNRRVRPRVWFVTANLANVALLGLFTLTGPASWVGYGALFLAGFALAGSMPILNAAYYSRAPQELMGRVTGAGWAVVLTALPLASWAMGWLLSVTSPVWGMATVLAGDLLVVAAFTVLRAFRLIDRYR